MERDISCVMFVATSLHIEEGFTVSPKDPLRRECYVCGRKKIHFGTQASLFVLFFHPVFRLGGPMEYFRGPRVERSGEMGRGL